MIWAELPEAEMLQRMLAMARGTILTPESLLLLADEAGNPRLTTLREYLAANPTTPAEAAARHEELMRQVRFG